MIIRRKRMPLFPSNDRHHGHPLFSLRPPIMRRQKFLKAHSQRAGILRVQRALSMQIQCRIACPLQSRRPRCPTCRQSPRLFLQRKHLCLPHTSLPVRAQSVPPVLHPGLPPPPRRTPLQGRRYRTQHRRSWRRAASSTSHFLNWATRAPKILPPCRQRRVIEGRARRSPCSRRSHSATHRRLQCRHSNRSQARRSRKAANRATMIHSKGRDT